MKPILLRCTFYLFCCIFVNAFYPQQIFASDAEAGKESVKEKETVEEDVIEDEPPTLEEQLLELQKNLSDKEKEKKQLERRLRSEKDEVVKERLTQELTAAEDIIIGMREEFVQFATGGTKVFKEPTPVQEEFDWRKDMELLFQPLIEQLRELTTHPQRIEQKQSEIAYWQKRRQELQLATDNLDKNIEAFENRTLKKEAQGLRETTASRLNSAEQKLALLENELAGLKTAKNPIWTTIGDIFVNIVFEILLHLIVAIVAACAAYQAIKWLSIIIIKLLPNNHKGGYKFAQRPIEIGRIIVSAIVTVSVYFIVLYSFTEWLLIVLSLLAVGGLALGLRETLPRYLMEVKTLLNMGSIRHGERLIYNGLPWQVSHLNVHTHLYNPAIKGKLRVPLAEIVNLSSRVCEKGEPWFPTDIGDIVLMEDGVYGRINQQTPDIVEVDRSYSIYTYSTQDFLSRRPRNLSRNGFSVIEVFGIDYQHQANITTTILDTYRQAIEEAIQTSSFGQYSKSITVAFNAASASSLDFKVIASFSGEAAEDYYPIQRLIQTASVEAANREGWVIPFQQITLHYEDSDIKPEPNATSLTPAKA